MPRLDNEESETGRAERPATPPREISLTEVWLILVKRRSLMLAIILVCTLAGVAIGVVRSERFSVSVALSVGTAGVGGGLTPIEAPTETVAKLQESYIPHLLAENPNFAALRVDVGSPANSQLVTLSAKGPASETAAIGVILTDLADAVVQEHETMIALHRGQAEANIQQLGQQIAQLETDVEGLEKERSRLHQLLTESRGPDSVTIALAHVEVERIIAGYRASAAQLRQMLFSEQDRLIAIESSRRISSALVSTRPTGPGLGAISLLAILLGVFVATIAALFTEFIAGSRRYVPSAAGNG